MIAIIILLLLTITVLCTLLNLTSKEISRLRKYISFLKTPIKCSKCEESSLLVQRDSAKGNRIICKCGNRTKRWPTHTQALFAWNARNYK